MYVGHQYGGCVQGSLVSVRKKRQALLAAGLMNHLVSYRTPAAAVETQSRHCCVVGRFTANIVVMALLTSLPKPPLLSLER